MIGEAKSFDCADHIVVIVKKYLTPMAIVAFEIGLARSDKIARDPRARADRPKIGYAGQGPCISAFEIFTAIAKTSQKRRATVAAVRDIDAVFVWNRRRGGCKCATQGQQHWQV